MPVILMRVSSWRCPWRFLYPVLFFELLDDDLRSAQIADDLCRHLDFRERVGVVCDGRAIDVQHRNQLDIAVLVGLDAVEDHNAANLDLFLAAASAHNCVNHV